MKAVKKAKIATQSSYEPVKKSTRKSKDANSGKNKSNKGTSAKHVPNSPTTEINPAG